MLTGAVGSSLRKRGSVPHRTVSGRTFARLGIRDGRRRGLKGLIGHGVIDARKHYKTAQQSPVGYTADHLIIESQDSGFDGRDRNTILDSFQASAIGPAFIYEWRTKTEPLLSVRGSAHAGTGRVRVAPGFSGPQASPMPPAR